VRLCPKSELDRRTASANHQGVVLEAEPFPETQFDELLEAALRAPEPAFLLVLDHLQDPQNLGSIMRSAEAAGVHGVVLARDRACGVTPAVVRASSGAVEHLPVARVANIAGTVIELERMGIRVWALEAAEGAQPIYECELSGPLALVVGAEGQGVQKRVRTVCTGCLVIPMSGQVASFNAAVSAAIAMYEVRRQRRVRGIVAGGTHDAAAPGG